MKLRHTVPRRHGMTLLELPIAMLVLAVVMIVVLLVFWLLSWAFTGNLFDSSPAVITPKMLLGYFAMLAGVVVLFIAHHFGRIAAWWIELQAERVGLAVWQWKKNWLLRTVVFASAFLVVFAALFLLKGGLDGVRNMSRYEIWWAGFATMIVNTGFVLILARYSAIPAKPIPYHCFN